jgi:hypothetical protein
MFGFFSKETQNEGIRQFKNGNVDIATLDSPDMN